MNVCDKQNNCPFGEDERNCSYYFSEFFTCYFNKKEKISYKKVCNFQKDCQDGSDEIDCGKN